MFLKAPYARILFRQRVRMLMNETFFTRSGSEIMKKMLRNAGAVFAAGGVGVYTVYKMVFGRAKKSDGMEMLQGVQYEPYEPVVRSGMEKKNGGDYL